MNLAPIALFVYNRLKHTKQTIEALQKNPLSSESDLFIFSDGAKNLSNKTEIKEVRNYLKTITGFKTISIIKRNNNLGLAQSIITGVTEVVNKYRNIIVLEDDLVTSPFFLEYMNSALETYKNIEDVISIHGYVYPVKKELPETFFIRGADCWGWATWKRGWELFEKDGKKLLNDIKKRKLQKEFDYGHSYPFIQMLIENTMGLNQSWAIRWYASAFLNNKLTLYPGKSLVMNVGFGAEGTHTGKTNIYNVQLTQERINVKVKEVIENREAKKIMRNYFLSPKPFMVINLIRMKNMVRIFWKHVCLILKK